MEYIFQVRQLSAKAFKKGPVLLKDFDLDLSKQKWLGIIGPSGCGKTSLLRTLAGLINPIEGKILLHGKSPQAWGWPHYRRQVLYIFQKPIVNDDSLFNNLKRPFQFHSAKKEFPLERAKELLERLDLKEDLWQKNARNLSVGEQQRMVLIRALLLQPKVLLFDEPTSALDEKRVDAVETLLKEETEKEDMGVILVTHQKKQAHRLCSQIISLENFMVSK